MRLSVRLDRNPLLPTHEHRLTTGLTVLPRPVIFTQADALHDHPWGPLTGTPSRQPGMGGWCPTVTGWGGAQSARCVRRDNRTAKPKASAACSEVRLPARRSARRPACQVPARSQRLPRSPQHGSCPLAAAAQPSHPVHDIERVRRTGTAWVAIGRATGLISRAARRRWGTTAANDRHPRDRVQLTIW